MLYTAYKIKLMEENRAKEMVTTKRIAKANWSLEHEIGKKGPENKIKIADFHKISFNKHSDLWILSQN